MGVFRCACCDREYWDKRFIWENEDPREKAVVDCPAEAASDCVDGAGTSTDDSDGSKAFGQIADTLRASGTASNVIGSIAPVMSSVCAPVSVVGGIVGAAGGVMQLQQGLYMPSGRVDPHLVTKGSVATGIGATCMTLGVCAFACPPLFLVALGLGIGGLGANTYMDANLDGLCHDCRSRTDNDPDSENEVEALEISSGLPPSSKHERTEECQPALSPLPLCSVAC